MAFVIIEVARAANDGDEVSQQDVKARIRARWRVKLADGTLSGYVKLLTSRDLGRIWLNKDGQTVTLSSEDTILTDSQCMKALVIAYGLSGSDEEQRITVRRWAEKCHYPIEKCRQYVQDYIRCGYVVENGSARPQLDRYKINKDLFYLRQAARAKLRGRPRRRPQSA